MFYRVHLAGAGFEITMLVVIGADCICSCKSNYHTTTTTNVPSNNVLSQLLFEIDKIMGIQKVVEKILSSNTKDNWIIIKKNLPMECLKWCSEM
jgi:acetolactate synthase small subunit